MVEVYTGLLKVSANNADSSTQDTYSNSKYFYGEGIGEMFDNMVEASMQLANEIFDWVKENKPSDYVLADEQWTYSISHPQILPNPMHEEEHDEQSSRGVKFIKDIVIRAVLQRELRIQSALSSLILATQGASELPIKPKKEFPDIYKASTFEEMSDCGFKGSDLEKILLISRQEGSMKAHNLSLQVSKRITARKVNKMANRLKSANRKILKSL